MPHSHELMSDEDETRPHRADNNTDRLLRLLAKQNEQVLAEQHEIRKGMQQINERLAGGQSAIEGIPDMEKAIADLLNRLTVTETRLSIMWWVVGVVGSTSIAAGLTTFFVVMGHHP